MLKSRRSKYVFLLVAIVCFGFYCWVLLLAVTPYLGGIPCVIGVPDESNRFHSKGLACSVVVPSNWEVIDLDVKLKVSCRERRLQGISISVESYGDDLEGWKKALEQEHIPMRYEVSTLKFTPDSIGGYDCLSAVGTSVKIPENFLDSSWHNLMAYWLVQHQSRTYLVVCDLHGPLKPDPSTMEKMKAYVATLRFD